jgi:hypothetical protein
LNKDNSFEAPHNTLSTRFGRLIDKVSYLQVALAAITIIASSAVYFWMKSGSADGLDKCAGKGFGEALYFSIITFSTVGYGDVTPIGWGRMVASTEVLIGLVLTALFIGKIASERQAALLLLIYTSDQQRRIAEFSNEIREFTASLDEPQVPSLENVKSASTLIRSLRAYLIFQSHQGRLADFGNGSALRNLYRAMDELQSSIEQLLKRLSLLEPAVEEEMMRLAERASRLAEIMKQFHSKERGIISTLDAISLKKAYIDNWEAASVTIRRQEKVRAVVPQKPWPKHFHKKAADDLGMSRNLFRQCMDALIKSGKI